MNVAALVLGILGTLSGFFTMQFSLMAIPFLPLGFGFVAVSWPMAIVAFTGAVLAYSNPKAGWILMGIGTVPLALFFMTVLVLGLMSITGNYDQTVHNKQGWLMVLFAIGLPLLCLGLATAFAYEASHTDIDEIRRYEYEDFDDGCGRGDDQPVSSL